MTTAAIREANEEPRARRMVLFRVVDVLAVLLFMVLFGGLISILDPWFTITSASEASYHPEIHRWQQAEWSAQMGILFGGSLLMLLWRPRAKPVLLQFLVLGIIIFALLIAPFSGLFVLVPMAIIGLIVAAYPWKRALIGTERQGPVSRPLLAISALGALLLAPISWHALQLQFTTNDELTRHHGWASAVVLALLLVLAGVLSATKRPGWETLGLLTGIALLYLGFAAVTVPPYIPGNWGPIGGTLSLLAGFTFIVVTIREARSNGGTVASERRVT